MTLSILAPARFQAHDLANLLETTGLETEWIVFQTNPFAALEKARGLFSILIDAQEVLRPTEYLALFDPLFSGAADVVLADPPCQTLSFRTTLIQSIPLHAGPSELPREILSKAARRHARIHSAHTGSLPRVTLTDRSLLPLDLYRDPGVAMLGELSRARKFTRWMADTIAPYVRGNVLEIGAGIGNLTELLAPLASNYTATDTPGEHLIELRRRLASYPNLRVEICDAAEPDDYRSFTGRFDSVVCLNVLEHISDDRSALQNIYSALRAGGRAIVLVPQGAAAFGSLDEVLHHQRRYSESELHEKMSSAGFIVEDILYFNRITYPGWILNSRILRRRSLSPVQLQLFNLLVPLWRRIDPLLPWPSTSLIAVGVKDEHAR